MIDIVLYQPEIPPNTGNVMRLCANTGARLHLVRPLGFQLTNRAMMRAGLDYRELATVCVHDDWPACTAALGSRRMFAASTRGTTGYADVSYSRDDILLFGSETRGLPSSVLESLPADQLIRIPMCAGSRSINLSNSVAVILFEAWRQIGFAGADHPFGTSG